MFLSLLAVFPSAAQSPQPSPVVSFPDGRASVEVPATIFNNVVYLPVAVNGSEPLEFALDTGAPDVSAVGLTNTPKLGLTEGAAMTVHGASQKQLGVRRLDGVVLSVGGIEFRNLRAVALALERLEPFWGHPMDGILGGNVLRQVVTCVDYARGRVTFFRPQDFEPSGRGESVPIEVEDNTLFMSAAVTAGDGRPAGTGRFLIDTGVRQSFLNTPFVRRHRLVEASDRVVETVTGFGISGPAFGTLGRLGSISLGASTLEQPIVQLCTEDSGIAASTSFDGILGADLVSRFSVCFDYGGNRMFLDPGPETFNPFVADASGLVFKASGDRPSSFSIAHVVEDSPADKAEVYIGDVVVAVDGRPASEFSLESLKTAMQGSGETCVRLRRDGTTRDVCFELRPLV